MQDKKDAPQGSAAKKVVMGVLGLIALILIWISFYTVPSGTRGIALRFNNASMTPVAPGIHFKVPFIDSYRLMSVQVQKSERVETSASKDLQEVTAQVAVNWHVNPAATAKIFVNVGGSITQKLIEPTVSNAVKAVTAIYNAEDIIANRDTLRDQIEEQLRAKLADYDIVVDGVNLTNISFSKAFNDAIEAKQVAQQKAQQASYDLQKARTVATQRLVEAKAQADAQEKIMKTLTPELIMQNAIEKWNGVLPSVVSGGAGGLTQLIAPQTMDMTAKSGKPETKPAPADPIQPMKGKLFK